MIEKLFIHITFLIPEFLLEYFDTLTFGRIVQSILILGSKNLCFKQFYKRNELFIAFVLHSDYFDNFYGGNIIEEFHHLHLKRLSSPIIFYCYGMCQTTLNKKLVSNNEIFLCAKHMFLI